MVSLLTVFGVLGLVGGGVNYLVYPTGLKMGLEMFINLKESGMVYPLYMQPPFPTNSSYFVYEVTNPREVLKGARMKFAVHGPYRFHTWMRRSNIEFKRGDELVKYSSVREQVPDEENSASDYDRKFWMLNPILVVVQSQVRSIVLDKVPFQSLSEPIVFNTVNVLMDQFKQRLFLKMSARDLLIGQKVELLEFLVGTAERLGLKSLLPPGPPNNVFGLAYVQNHTIDTVEVWTGIKDPKKFANLHSWNGKERLTVWDGACNNIEGTNGELYKPYLLEPKPIKVFLVQICRGFHMMPATGQLVDGAHGVMGYEYSLSPRLFQGLRTFPRNKCFCKNPKTYDCQFDGLMPMSPCFFDVPIFFAKGNFRDVDPVIKNMFDAETAVDARIPDKQSFYLDPLTGTLLRANLTLTGMFKMVKQPYMRDLANVRNITYAPLFVAVEEAVLPFELLRPVYYLQMMNDNYKMTSALMSAGGTGLLLMSFFF